MQWSSRRRAIFSSTVVALFAGVELFGIGGCEDARLPLGYACLNAADCVMGFCTDGVCCESSCDQPCVSCNLPGKQGTCSPTATGSEDSDSTPWCVGPNSLCDGNGQCVHVLGQTCTDAMNCTSGHCADGVCCDSACTDTCKTCALPGAEGTCTNLPANESDPLATMPCNGSQLSCNGSGECKIKLGGACTTNPECATGFCSNGTCQTYILQTGPVRWVWSNDQSVCKDPNARQYLDQYPSVKIRQIVARDDESVVGVGDYVLPSMGLPCTYNTPSNGFTFTESEGPHPFQLSVVSDGSTASWSSVAQYSVTYTLNKSCLGHCYTGTSGLGPFLEAAGGDVVSYRKVFYLEKKSFEATTSCYFAEFLKQAAPQWSLGTNDLCIDYQWRFAGNAAGHVVTSNNMRLKRYDAIGAIVLDTPNPFGFSPWLLALAASGDIHAASHSYQEVSFGRTDPSGMLVWTRNYPNIVPMGQSPKVHFAVDALGNSIVAFYAYDTMDLGNGPMPGIGSKDLMLAKFDPSGNLLWAKRMGSSNFAPIDFDMRNTGVDEIALLVHATGFVDLGDGLLQSSPVVVKYDGNGNLVWRADLLPLYPPSGPEVLSVAISGHPSGAVFVAGTGYGLASSMPTPNCDLGANNLPGTYPRSLRMFTAKYEP